MWRTEWIQTALLPNSSHRRLKGTAHLTSCPLPPASNAQYIVSGSDDGSFFIWEKETTNLVRVLQGDESIVNCLQPHPSYCFLATSGIDPVVRLWNPRPESEDLTGRVVEDMEGASQANQRRMNADPLEVMLLNMGYRITGLSSGGAGASDDEDSSEGQVQCRPS